MRKKAPRIPDKKAYAILKAALYSFNKDGDNLTYQKSSEEVSVGIYRGKITVTQRCYPMSEGWSISEFGCTESGIKNAIRRAKAEAGIQ